MNNHIKIICNDLNIKRPKVSHDTSVFTSATMLAMASPGGGTIHIPNRPADPDLLFSVAHELRHIWQMKEAPQIFANYKPREHCFTVQEYNLQEAELDANAYAGHMMIKLHGLYPRFDGLSAIVKSEIYQRMNAFK